MANLTRIAKSGIDWSEHEFEAFNIGIQAVDATTFFGNPVLPPAPVTVSDVILNNIDRPANFTKTDHQFFALLEDTSFTGSEESLVDDFVAFLLDLMDYNNSERVIHCRKELGFVMCGQNVNAKPNVCMLDHPGLGRCVLVVQEDKV